MHHPNPWRRARQTPEVVISWRDDLPPPMVGATEGDQIWISSKLKQVERRCVMAHEWEHRERGHQGCQPERVEARVRSAAARYLLPHPHVVADALVWARLDLVEAADVLWVTPETLRHRLDRRHLHPREVVIIERRLAEVEGGC